MHHSRYKRAFLDPVIYVSSSLIALEGITDVIKRDFANSLRCSGMVAALLVYANILKTPSGDGRVKEIADEIHLVRWFLWQANTNAWACFV